MVSLAQQGGTKPLSLLILVGFVFWAINKTTTPFCSLGEVGQVQIH